MNTLLNFFHGEKIMAHVCPICKIEKDENSFYKRANRGTNQSYCKDCSKEKHKEHNHKLKLEIFEVYGGAKCACCGENKHHSFLAIDHIKGNGSAHRRSLNMPSGGYRFYSWLKRDGYPKGYQVLCHNCNVAKAIMGECPHKSLLADSVTGSITDFESVGESPNLSPPTNIGP